MSWVSIGVAGASLLMGAYSASEGKKAAGREAEYARRGGEARRVAANLEANVLEQQASNTIGAAQRDMIDLQRQSRMTQSRAIALAAASGGGASSAPTVVKLVGDLAKEGSYNAARALYAGQEKERLMRLQARELREMGEFAVVGGNIMGAAAESRGRAAEMKGYASMLETGGGLYAKYSSTPRNAGTTGATPTSNFYYSGTDADGGPAYG